MTTLLSKFKLAMIAGLMVVAASVTVPAFLEVSRKSPAGLGDPSLKSKSPVRPGSRSRTAELAAKDDVAKKTGNENVDKPAPRSKNVTEAIELASRAFGPTHWSADPKLPVLYSNPKLGFRMYAREYTLSADGKRVRFKPFAVISKSRDGKGLTTAISDGAVIDLDQPLALAASKPNAHVHITHVRIEGNVLIRGDKGTPDQVDDLVIGPMPYVDYDNLDLQIKCDSEIVIRAPDQRITGVGLLIQLSPHEGYPRLGAVAGLNDVVSDILRKGVLGVFLRKDVHIMLAEPRFVARAVSADSPSTPGPRKP